MIGISKGKGFQGVVKRHHFRGGGGYARLDVPPRSGLDRRLGLPVARLPGMRMGGRMGDEQVTVQNLEIVEVDAEDNVIS